MRFYLCQELITPVSRLVLIKYLEALGIQVTVFMHSSHIIE
jgi:hypothetical protein